MNDAEYNAWFAEFALPKNETQVAVVPQVMADANAPQLFAPFIGRIPNLSTRLGYGMYYRSSLADLPAARQLRAGWYHNWVVQDPGVVKSGMEYVQTVRLHQALECPIGTDWNRQRCPYVVPYRYTVRPGISQIQATARSRPGSLWLIGNEMDRMDWGRPGWGNVGFQDEMLPEVYARAYHELYHAIKAADSTAKVAIGGIVQPTPLRLEYLSNVWDTYGQAYGQEMPVDVWNTHNFIIREGANSDWGAGIPPGLDATSGEYVMLLDENGDRTHHMDMDIFDRQIRAYRQWMKERGQQNKPLIVSEYGVLYPNHTIFPSGAYPSNDPTPVVDFMLASFDYFQNTKDCEIGYLADDCLLVQAWNWFSLDIDLGYNSHGRLLTPGGAALTPAGAAFSDYARQNFGALARPYPIP